MESTSTRAKTELDTKRIRTPYWQFDWCANIYAPIRTTTYKATQFPFRWFRKIKLNEFQGLLCVGCENGESEKKKKNFL